MLGEPLQPCCTSPVTGYLRDGYCSRAPYDRGMHLVCAVVMAEFLAFTERQGNDLSTPVPEHDFPGLLQFTPELRRMLFFVDGHGVAGHDTGRSTHGRQTDSQTGCFCAQSLS